MQKDNRIPGTLPKTPSGIKGFDEITLGGLPRGRPVLVCGGPGSGKTLFGMEFLVRGAADLGEPGVFMSFEESEADLMSNFVSLSFDLERMQADKQIVLDYVHIDPAEIEETGEYNLEGLFVRLALAIDAVGARRVVLDTLEALFSGFANQFILRSEIRRLFRWLKDRGVTAVITAERGQGEGGLTRQGLEEYVSDCVIELDHRVQAQISTRYLRVVKYRGTTHGTNRYPFLIDQGGIFVMPITSVGLDYDVAFDRISTGVDRLDAMLGGQGVHRGSSVLISGSAGTGKTSFAAAMADAACRRGEHCLYCAFEESSRQIVRNMRSIGLDLQQWVDRGLLHHSAVRPTLYGMEMHVAEINRLIDRFGPSLVVIDPVSNLINIASLDEVKTALMRLVDILKSRLITSLFTMLLQNPEDASDNSPIGVSSLMDTWIVLRDMRSGGEHNRGLHIVKSRGTAHSNQIREFLLSERGLDLIDVYTGPAGVLTGAARIAMEKKERDDALRLDQEIARKKRELSRRRQIMEAEAALLRNRLESAEEELAKSIEELELRKRTESADRHEMAHMRQATERTER